MNAPDAYFYFMFKETINEMYFSCKFFVDIITCLYCLIINFPKLFLLVD